MLIMQRSNCLISFFLPFLLSKQTPISNLLSEFSLHIPEIDKGQGSTKATTLYR